jgi:hypothetical protein
MKGHKPMKGDVMKLVKTFLMLAGCGLMIACVAGDVEGSLSSDEMALDSEDFDLEQCIEIVERWAPGQGEEVCTAIQEGIETLEGLVELCESTRCVGAAAAMVTDTCAAGKAVLYAEDEVSGQLELVYQKEMPITDACSASSAGAAFVAAFEYDPQTGEFTYGFGLGAASSRGIFVRLKMPSGNVVKLVIRLN